MSPGKWCDLGEQLGGNIDALGADIIDSAAEIDGVPQDNGVTTRKWRICPTFKNVSGIQVGLTVDVVAFSALRAS